VCSLSPGLMRFGAVADEEVLLPLQARFLLQHRDADLLVAPGRRSTRRSPSRPSFMWRPTLVDEPIKGRKSGMCASSTGVGTATMIMSASANKRGVVGVDGMPGLGHLRVFQLARRVVPRRQASTLFLADVEADGAHLLAELHDERQAHVAQADDGNGVHGCLPFNSVSWLQIGRASPALRVFRQQIVQGARVGAQERCQRGVRTPGRCRCRHTG